MSADRIRDARMDEAGLDEGGKQDDGARVGGGEDATEGPRIGDEGLRAIIRVGASQQPHNVHESRAARSPSSIDGTLSEECT
jgi:hypothetical protein